MKILHASSEIAPFAKTGGLADVLSGLPLALARAGMDVVRVMPFYRQVKQHKNLTRIDVSWEVPLGKNTFRAGLWAHKKGPVTTYFIDRKSFYNRKELYGTSRGNYADNTERFLFFQKSVVALIDTLDLQPDLVHLHDWQTGLIPFFLKHGLDGSGRHSKEKTLYTIHNLAYQGNFPMRQKHLTNLPSSCFRRKGMMFYGKLGSMKAGILAADWVSTVSPSYSAEIRKKNTGCGLHKVLQRRRNRLSGILNGVDYDEWDPAVDPHLVRHYTWNRITGKTACRKDLLSGLGLEVRDDRAILGMVTRLVDQKGFDILAKAMPAIMDNDVTFILLGKGQSEYHALAKTWAKKWPGRCSINLTFDNTLAHKIEAGSDIFLMPSRFEPCGLNQMYSLRYGTIPVVHATGGLNDSIIPVRGSKGRGTGYKFQTYSPLSLVRAVNRAVKDYTNRKFWQAMMVRAMKKDFSWDHAVKEYVRLYKRILEI